MLNKNPSNLLHYIEGEVEKFIVKTSFAFFISVGLSKSRTKSKQTFFELSIISDFGKSLNQHNFFIFIVELRNKS